MLNLDPEALRRIVAEERRKSLSQREWKFRLAGHGIAVRPTRDGIVISSLLNGGDLCTMDTRFAA